MPKSLYSFIWRESGRQQIWLCLLTLVIVPLSAVRDADAAPWVLRLEGRHAVRRPVQLGLRSGGLAEVLGGVTEGDAVLVGSATLKAGARVRATSAAASAASAAAAVPQ